MTKILVIEDAPATRDIIVASLKLEGYDVFSADNGVDGLRLAQEILPDLILCDIVMPKMDGYSVLGSLRKNPLTATVLFIFTSGKGRRGELRQGMEMGADDYLPKPFSADELSVAVRVQLDKRAAVARRMEHKLAETHDFVVPDVQQTIAEMRPLVFVIDGRIMALPISESILVGRVADEDAMPHPDVDLAPFAAESKGVSRRHVRLTRSGDNVYITDLDSKNGTFINDKRLPSNIETPLNNNDNLRLGNLKIEVRI